VQPSEVEVIPKLVESPLLGSHGRPGWPGGLPLQGPVPPLVRAVLRGRVAVDAGAAPELALEVPPFASVGIHGRELNTCPRGRDAPGHQERQRPITLSKKRLCGSRT
jgi:hypothetical protein